MYCAKHNWIAISTAQCPGQVWAELGRFHNQKFKFEQNLPFLLGSLFFTYLQELDFFLIFVLILVSVSTSSPVT